MVEENKTIGVQLERMIGLGPQKSLAFVLLMFSLLVWNCNAYGRDNIETCNEVFGASKIVSPSRNVLNLFQRLAVRYFADLSKFEDIYDATEKIAKISPIDREIFLVRFVWGIHPTDAAVIFQLPPKYEDLFDEMHVRERMEVWDENWINLAQAKKIALSATARLIPVVLRSNINIEFKYLPGWLAETLEDEDEYGDLKRVDREEILSKLEVKYPQFNVGSAPIKYNESEFLERIFHLPHHYYTSEPYVLRRQLAVFNNLPATQKRLIYGHYVMRLPLPILVKIIGLESLNSAIESINTAIQAMEQATQTKPTLSVPSSRNRTRNVTFTHQRVTAIQISNEELKVTFSGPEVVTAQIGQLKLFNGYYEMNEVMLKLYNQFYADDSPELSSETVITPLSQAQSPSEVKWYHIPDEMYEAAKVEISAINNLPSFQRFVFFFLRIARLKIADVSKIIGVEEKEIDSAISAVSFSLLDLFAPEFSEMKKAQYSITGYAKLMLRTKQKQLEQAAPKVSD